MNINGYISDLVIQIMDDVKLIKKKIHRCRDCQIVDNICSVVIVLRLLVVPGACLCMSGTGLL